MKKQIIITTSWDDGHILDLKLASLLKKYKIAATFYVAPSNHEFEKKDLLKDGDIKQLSRDFEIGAHTMTHPKLSKVTPGLARKEILESKTYLEKVTSKKVNSFCYPYGDFDENVKNIVKKSGFKLARTVERFESSARDPYALGTSAHVYSHMTDVLNPKILLTFRSIDWYVIARSEFDRVLKNGGIFHLWGHSWEIEKNNEWKKLEKLLAYIAKKPGLKYLKNSELI